MRESKTYRRFHNRIKAAAACIALALAFSASLAAPIDPSPENLLSPGKDWPQWRGPNGTACATPAGQQLRESFSEARLVWTSEEAIPDARTSDYSNTNQTGVNGGFASPIVANGCVYLFYYVPSGTVYADFTETQGYVYSNGVTKDKWLIGADDVVLCVDAQTGRTKWKKVFRDGGLNWQHFNKAGPGLTPCYHDGRIYAIGTTGRIYCLNAGTGDSLWAADIGPRNDMMEELKRISLDTEKMYPFNRDFLSSPVVIGDAVVCNTHELAKGNFPNYGVGDDGPLGMIAHDRLTGDSLWHKDACSGLMATAAAATLGSQACVLTGRDNYPPEGDEHLFCLNASTGAVMWRLDDNTYNGGGVVTHGNHLFCRDSVTGAKQFACYSMSATAATREWGFTPDQLDAAPLVMNGHVYVRTSSELKCFNISSGRQVATAPLSGGMGYLVGSDNIIITDVDHAHRGDSIYLFKADPSDLRRLDGPWGIPAVNGYGIPVMPALADGRMFIRHRDRLACYDFRTSAAVSTQRWHRMPARVTFTCNGIAVSGLSPHGARITLSDLRGRRVHSAEYRSSAFIRVPAGQAAGVRLLMVEQGEQRRVIPLPMATR